MKSISIKDIEFNIEEKGYENFWSNIKSWEVKNLEFIKSNFSEDQIFIDIGSWIGPYTIFAAKLGMKVYSYEPDNIAYKILKYNISLNKFKSNKPSPSFLESIINISEYIFLSNRVIGCSFILYSFFLT